MKNKTINFKNPVGTISMVIIALLVILNVWGIYRFKSTQQIYKDNIVGIEDDLRNLESTKEEFKSMVFNNLHSESSTIESDFVLTDLDSDSTVPIIDYMDNEQLVLVLRFNEFSCHVCIERIFEEFHLIPDSYKPKKLVIFASYENIRTLRLFKQNYLEDLQIQIFLSDSMSIPIEQLNVPYFFLLNSNLVATHIFYPITSSPDLIGNYFKVLQNKYPSLFSD